MLIPNVKFLVLPLVALAVIAALPSTATTDRQGQPSFAATPAKPAAVTSAKPATECEQPGRTAPNCTHVAKLSNDVVVR